MENNCFNEEGAVNRQENDNSSARAAPSTSRPNDRSLTDQKLSESGSPLFKLSEHHKKTGCSDGLEIYGDSGGVGAFCSSCKEEWLLEEWPQVYPNLHVVPDSNFKQVAHHYVPTFCCLQVSDTGHYVRWRDIDKLKQGDHVAWHRPLSYWHHAIVKEDVKKGDEKVTVIEWSGKGIRKDEKKKVDLVGNLCYSPMYKVVYPREIEDQNPPHLVILRARKMKQLSKARKKDYSILFDNCEHFATFCKTGSHKCNQLFQYRARLRAWIIRLFIAFLHIVVVVFFSETIEWLVPTIDKDWLAVTVLMVFELLSLAMIIFITYKIDTPREGFKRKHEINDKTSCTSACKGAIIKNVLQSLTFMGFVALFGIYVVRQIGRRYGEDVEQWSVKKRVGIEMLLGCIGGIIGNIIGFILFHFIPYPCCNTVIGPGECEAKDVGETEV